MGKHSFIALICALLFGVSTSTSAQTVTIAFTGKKYGSSQYMRLSKVVITNITRNWTETIYYPDTILQLSCGVGIDDFVTDDGFALSQNIPNPFAGQTDFVLRMVEADNAHIAVYDMNGKMITGLDQQLSKGIHSFRIMLTTPQAYILKVHTKKNSGTVKILNTGNAGENRIYYLGETNYQITYQLEAGKGNSNKPFMLGDLMQYVGFTNYYGSECHSQTVTQAQTSSELFTLKFSCENQPPVVNLSPVTSITHNSAVCGGEVISEGTGSVIDRGVCWNTEAVPTINNYCTHDGTGGGSFTSHITGLNPGTLYHLRAYARNNVSIAYSSDGYTSAPAFYTLPYVVTDDIPDILPTSVTTSVTLHGQVQYSTSVNMISKGFCWSTSPNPTINDNQVSSSSAGSNISATVTGLTRGVTYYVRAYAQINGNPLVYGNEVSFVAVDYPVVTTNNISNITTTSATCGGNVTSGGGVSVTARGVYYSTSSNFEGSYFMTTNGSGTGNFTSNLTNLTPNTTYYVKAYATNSAGTRFGAVKSFTTAPLPVFTVTTNTVTNVTATSATCGGTVTPTGSAITARGVCWSTTQNPTVSDNHTSNGSGTGSYSSSITGLTPVTTYYVRAYAFNSTDTVYGNEVSFITQPGSCPAIPTVTDIDGNTYNTVQIGNQCWMREALRTTKYADGTAISAGNTSTNQTSTIEALYYTYIEGILYNWTAATRNISSSIYNPFGVKGVCPDGWHVPNDAEWNQLINYVGSQSQYVCGNSNDNIAKALASIYWDGYGSTISCAVGNEPQYNNSSGFNAERCAFYDNNGFHHGCAYFWSATQSYCYALEYYSPTVHHYYQNKSLGCSVRCLHNGDSITYPTVTTSQASIISATSVVCGGIISDDGNAMVIDRGLCWSTSQNPSLQIGQHSSDGSDTSNFTRIITGLVPNTTYYIRAYATNLAGTSYGNQETFTTPLICGTSTITDYDNNIYHTVKIGNQCWLKENIRSTHYSDGTSIPQGSNTLSTTIGYRYTPNSNANISTYGYLYNWRAAIRTSSSSSANPSGVQGICPNGWHLPSENEWSQLSNYLKSQSQYICGNSNISIAKALASKTGWNSSTTTCAIGNNLNTNNATGFSALPAGNYGSIHDLFGMYAKFWSSTESSATDAKTYILYYGYARVEFSGSGKQYGMSVRCLRDFQFLVATNLVTNITGTTAVCGGTVYYNGDSTVINRGVCWSTLQNPTLSDNHTVDSSGSGSFTSHITGLTPSTIYYVRAYAINGADTLYGDSRKFITSMATLPLVTTDSVNSISLTSAICGGNVTSDGGENVTAHGVCWSTSPNPTMSDNYSYDGNGTGGFSSLLTGLAPNTSYYVRAYATNGVGTSYGENRLFTTLSSVACPNAPTVTDYDGNTYNTVQIGNQCWMKENLKTTHFADGTEIPLTTTTTTYPWVDTIPLRYYPNNSSSNLTRYGYWYNWKAVMKNSSSSNNNPSGRQGICPVGWHVPSKAEWEQLINYVSGQVIFSCNFNNTYIAKALADTTGWWTSNNNSCVVGFTQNHNNTTGFSAVPAGFGGSSGSAIGGFAAFGTSTMYYGDNNYPYFFSIQYDKAVAELKFYSYSFSVRCLRAESDGPTTPSVMSDTVSNITDTTAMCGGDVVTDGNVPVIARGVCWSTSQNPKISDSHTTDGTGTGNFTSNIVGLIPGTTYYLRAYATNSLGTAYGELRNFTTSSSPCAATVSDHEGNVYNTVQIGNQCWTKENLRTTTSPSTGTYLIPAAGTGPTYTGKQARWYNNDSATYAPMNYGLLYNWNAAVDTFNTAYGETSVNLNGWFPVSFTGHRRGICPVGWHLPSDAEWATMTDHVSSQSQYVCGGNTNYIAKAFADSVGWNSHSGTCCVGNDQSANNATGFSAVPAGYCSSTSGTDAGSYAYFWSATQLSHLYAYKRSLYYYSPFVDEYYEDPSDGCSVRCIRDELSAAILPTVTTNTISSIAATSATCSGNVTATGGASVTARGVCWSTSQSPTVSNSHTTDGSGTGNFTSSITGLAGSTTYYVRAYATNSVGTAYGTQLSFTTSASTPIVTTESLSNITATTAICGGDVSSDGGSSVIARGVCWSTTQNPTVSGNHTTDGSGTGSFTSSITGLTAGTTYYVRAFATNSAGTGYGEPRSFTTSGSSTSQDGQPCFGAAIVSDHEGNVYNTVQIGNQCWTKENLRTTTSPSTGTYLIPAGGTDYTYTGKQARWYNNDSATYAPMNYGVLYNWNAAVDTFNTAYGETSVNTNSSSAVSVTFNGHRRGICPVGWHLPSDAEWTAMTDYVSSQSQYVCGGDTSYIAKALADSVGWYSKSGTCYVGNDQSANNATGFSAVPAGYCYGLSFNTANYSAILWSATQDSSSNAYYRNLSYQKALVLRSSIVKRFGYSVRCLRD